MRARDEPLTPEQWRLVETHRALAFKVAYRVLSYMKLSPATMDELVHDIGLNALIQAARRFDRARGFQFITYAWRVLVSAYGRYAPAYFGIRKGVRLVVAETDLRGAGWVYQHEPSTRSHVADVDNADEVAVLLGMLPPRERAALEGVYLRGLSDAEAGRRLGVSGQRVGQLRNRAIRAIRRCMAAAKTAPGENGGNA